MPDLDPTTAAAPFRRTGAAARGTGAATGRVRRPRTRPASPEPTSDTTAPVAAATAPVTVTAVPDAGAQRTGAAAEALRARLEDTLATLTDAQRKAVTTYRPRDFQDAEWDQVADLVRLGIAVAAPPSTQGIARLRSALALHARLHLAWGTSRTVPGWYGRDAVERTLTHPPEAATARTLASYAGRLRRVSAELAPPPAAAPAPPRWRSYDPLGPYSTEELAGFLDQAEARTSRLRRQRVLMLIWTVLGTGVTLAEARLLTPAHFRLTDVALLLDVPGPAARTVPVRHECEGPVLELLHGRDPDASVFDGMEPGSGQVGVIAEHAHLHVNDASLRPQRLRTTWVALVTASGAPLPALMKAAAIKGERTFTHVAAALDLDLDAASTVQALRGSGAPLPRPGQMLLPGVRYPAPHIPLRPLTGDRS